MEKEWIIGREGKNLKFKRETLLNYGMNRVDFYIQVKDKYIGLQIKPISSGMALDQY